MIGYDLNNWEREVQVAIEKLRKDMIDQLPDGEIAMWDGTEEPVYEPIKDLAQERLDAFNEMLKAREEMYRNA